jgi:hypothetical protein
MTIALGAEVEDGVVHRRDGFDQCRPLAQAQSEVISKRRQDAHADIAIGPRDERVFAGPFGWRGRVIAALGGGPNRGGWRGEAQEPRRRVKGDPRIGQTIGIERGEVANRRSYGVFGVIGLDPGVLEPRHVGEVGWSIMQLRRTELVIASVSEAIQG